MWGLAATSLMILDQQGMLQPYAPKGVEKLSPAFVDKAKPPKWTGMDVWAATICFNTVEAAKKNLPKPESWADLTKPAYKGQIVMPHPASSGTGYLDVSAWLQMMGEKRAGIIWTSCTPIWPSTSTPAPSRARWPPPASTR